MTPDRFRRIDEIFNCALDLDPAGRRRFLDDECREDRGLRSEVEALLDAADSAQHRLAGAIQKAAANVEAGDAGSHAGPYLLVRELGRGGMGAVYQAIRTDGEFLHTVAVKLVKRGMDSDAILRRFRAERQILAGLSHPNIARLLDGGTTADGRPYLVMEYIDGEPLLTSAARRQLSVRDRVELFRPVCRAVDFAHRAHVLHRDLKPGNVMVTGDGQPKLLDFGIAKLLLPELVAGDAPETETGARLMTPGYASPEQVTGGDLTAATDVYSLGVLLFELLTGERPFSSIPRNAADVGRAIAEDTAPKASDAAADPRVRVELAGDLDTILAMALRKEPARRYVSAAALEEDLGRYLDGLPVRARPDTFRYRAAKWARRHRTPAILAAALALLMLAAGVDQWHEWRNAVPEEALELCRRAEQMLRADIRATEPGQGLPEPLRESIELWERATRLAPRYVPAWTGLAGAAEFAIDYDAARAPRLRQASVEAARRALALDPASAAAHATLGALRYRDWDFAGAASDFERSVALDPHQPYVLADLADCLSLAGRHSEAIQVLERALGDPRYAQVSQGPNVRASVVLLNALASHYRAAGWLDRAREKALEAIRLQGNYAPSRLLLALIFEQSGDAAGAERELRTAFAMRPADQRNVAALGHLMAKQGRRTEALEMFAHLDRLRSEGVPVDGSRALIHAGLGDGASALAALEMAAKSREAGLPYRLSDPRLNAVLATPRGRALAMGVAPGGR
ncbi:MAG: protein kinase [Bryobacteraceae bacterium]